MNYRRGLFRLWLIATAALAMSACQRPVSLVVVVIDVPKLPNCQTLSPGNVHACAENPEFWESLGSQFAAQPACAGVLTTVADLHDQEAARAINKRLIETPEYPPTYWRLSVSFDTDAKQHSWTLSRGLGGWYSGDGGVSQIANDACNFARGRGGTVEDLISP
jgi:hypothetical protein